MGPARVRTAWHERRLRALDRAAGPPRRPARRHRSRAVRRLLHRLVDAAGARDGSAPHGSYCASSCPPGMDVDPRLGIAPDVADEPALARATRAASPRYHRRQPRSSSDRAPAGGRLRRRALRRRLLRCGRRVCRACASRSGRSIRPRAARRRGLVHRPRERRCRRAAACGAAWLPGTAARHRRCQRTRSVAVPSGV
jgi:hypothetical protein